MTEKDGFIKKITKRKKATPKKTTTKKSEVKEEVLELDTEVTEVIMPYVEVKEETDDKQQKYTALNTPLKIEVKKESEYKNMKINGKMYYNLKHITGNLYQDKDGNTFRI